MTSIGRRFNKKYCQYYYTDSGLLLLFFRSQRQKLCSSIPLTSSGCCSPLSARPSPILQFNIAKLSTKIFLFFSLKARVKHDLNVIYEERWMGQWFRGTQVNRAG